MKLNEMISNECIVSCINACGGDDDDSVRSDLLYSTDSKK